MFGRRKAASKASICRPAPNTVPPFYTTLAFVIANPSGAEALTSTGP
jgi:hypothetical protein